MEIRDYAYVVGRQLFGELEWFIVIVGFVLVSQASYVVFALWLRTAAGGQSSLCLYLLFILTLAWSFRVMWFGQRFDKLQIRQIKALINQSACIRSEIITSAIFAGPPKWIKLKVGTWDRLYNLTHTYHKYHKKRSLFGSTIASLNSIDSINNNNNNQAHMAIESPQVPVVFGSPFSPAVVQQLSVSTSGGGDFVARNEMKESENETIRELQTLQESFNQYLHLIDLFTSQVELNKIHPKIFGMKLSGALFKAIVVSGIGFVASVVKVIFF